MAIDTERTPGRFFTTFTMGAGMPTEHGTKDCATAKEARGFAVGLVRMGWESGADSVFLSVNGEAEEPVGDANGLFETLTLRFGIERP